MIQIRLSHPFPHPQPSLFPPPQQQSKIKRSRQLLFPPKQDEPQDPPQPVAAKSLMLIPPELSLHFQYMHHGMSDFHSEDEKCCSSFPAEAVAEGKILYGPNVSVLLLLHVV